MILSESKQKEFASDGIVKLERALSRSVVRTAADTVLHELSRLGLRQNNKWQLKSLDGLSPFQVTAKIGQRLNHDAAFDDVIPDSVLSCMNTLAGSTLRPSQPHPQILITPPQKEPWHVPEHGWHVDIKNTLKDVIPGIQAFVLLADVAKHGGGTLAAKGSHLVRPQKIADEQILEMCGTAGDLYLMDMRVLHAPSINATKQPRLMLTNRYLNP